MNLKTAEIKKALGQNWVEGLNLVSDDVWQIWSTDSRETNTNGLFFALAGEKFDGHDFLDQALKHGAKGLVVSSKHFKDKKLKLSGVQVFIVNETTMAFQQIAQFWAQKLKCRKVAITGTSGKTSAKYFCHQLLEGTINHFFSPKSFNNHIGVPITLLGLKPEHEVGLFEIGMNHPGEIESLVKLVKPSISLVTMVGRGHLEGVGSIEGVLNEKMSIYEEGQVHIINVDDERIFSEYQKRFFKNLKDPDIKIIKVSLIDKNADVYFSVVDSKFDSFQVEGHIFGVKGKSYIPIAGEHHALNIALATAVAASVEMSAEDIWSKLADIKPVWGRSEIIKTKNDISIYFDAYNANPESMKAFLKQTTYLSNSPYFVLGEMLEMGKDAKQLHFELGRLVAQTPHKKVWFIGPSSQSFAEGYGQILSGENLIISAGYEQSLALKYQSMLKPKDWVALKASRGIGLEKFLNDFI